MMRTKRDNNQKTGNSIVKMITIGAIIGLVVSMLLTLRPQKRAITLTVPTTIEETVLEENVEKEDIIKETIATGKLWWN